MREGKTYMFDKTGGENMPIKSESVDEIVIINVAGDPKTGILKFENIMKDSKRVLRAGGTARIIETNTPDIIKPEKLIAVFEKNGFKLLEHLKLSEKNINRFMEYHEKYIMSPYSFMLIFSKI